MTQTETIHDFESWRYIGWTFSHKFESSCLADVNPTARIVGDHATEFTQRDLRFRRAVKRQA